MFERSFNSCDATIMYRNCSRKLLFSAQPSLELIALYGNVQSQQKFCLVELQNILTEQES